MGQSCRRPLQAALRAGLDPAPPQHRLAAAPRGAAGPASLQRQHVRAVPSQAQPQHRPHHSRQRQSLGQWSMGGSDDRSVWLVPGLQLLDKDQLSSGHPAPLRRAPSAQRFQPLQVTAEAGTAQEIAGDKWVLREGSWFRSYRLSNKPHTEVDKGFVVVRTNVDGWHRGVAIEYVRIAEDRKWWRSVFK